MDSWRARFLYFLVLLIACAQVLEVFALLDLRLQGSGRREDVSQYKFEDIVLGIVFALGPCIVPPLAFAISGHVLFRYFTWAMWSLIACALLFTIFILFGLLTEYEMSRAAVAAAAQGRRYMNCGGHPRLFFFLFAPTMTAVAFVICAVVVAVEAMFHALTTQMPANVTVKS